MCVGKFRSVRDAEFEGAEHLSPSGNSAVNNQHNCQTRGQKRRERERGDERKRCDKVEEVEGRKEVRT